MHNSYIIPGVVDGAVMHKQAQDRAEDQRHPESTKVHAHRRHETCNDKCVTYPAKEA